MAIIALENIQLFGKHGCYESEKILGGHYNLDVYVRVDIAKAAQSDDLEDTIDYEGVHNFCIDLFGQRHNLLESLAYKMAEGLLVRYPKAEGIRVVLSKLHPPLPGEVGKSSVDYATSKY